MPIPNFVHVCLLYIRVKIICSRFTVEVIREQYSMQRNPKTNRYNIPVTQQLFSLASLRHLWKTVCTSGNFVAIYAPSLKFPVGISPFDSLRSLEYLLILYKVINLQRLSKNLLIYKEFLSMPAKANHL